MIFGHHIDTRYALLACADILTLYIAFWSFQFLPSCQGCVIDPSFKINGPTTLLLMGILLLTTTSFGLYNSDAVEDFRIFSKRFLIVWQLLLIPAGLTFVLTKIASGHPLGWQSLAFAAAVAAFVAVLFALHRLIAWGMGLSFMKSRILVLGSGPSVEALSGFLTGPGRSHFLHVDTVGDWRQEDDTPPPVGHNVPALPSSEPGALLKFAQMLKTDEIVVAVDSLRNLPATELIECKLRGIKVVDAISFLERETGQIDAAKIAPEWLAFSTGFVSNHSHRILKRTVDLTISATFLLFTLPLCVLVAIAIKLDSPGPIFYRQERVGLNGGVFQLWKFRSMRADAERDGTPRWASTVDDRVTRVGRFIRLVRIDEIPQVINVLSGDMSFIGPRPERPFFVEQLRELLPNYDLRHRVRPGITGWAQVNYPYGASIEDASRKLAYDLFYLKKNDVLLDLAILMQTVRVVLFAQGAR